MTAVAQEPLPEDPLAAVRVLADTEVQLDQMRRDRVIAARAEGASWQQIGDALGVSRQSAWEAFTAEVRAALEANATDSGLEEDEAIDVTVSESRAVRQRRRRAT
ncbi:MAG: helix-turn-helix domain-containing protein [Acidimicrobiales bacterium]|nr:helix-turn-helix domain-containing protein [Acidimicrobiales bacterium]